MNRIPNHLIPALNRNQFKFHTWKSFSLIFSSLFSLIQWACRPNVLLRCFAQHWNVRAAMSEKVARNIFISHFSVSLENFASSVAKKKRLKRQPRSRIWFGVISVHNTPKGRKILVQFCERELASISVKIILSASSSSSKAWHKEVWRINELKCRAGDVILIIINYSSVR